MTLLFTVPSSIKPIQAEIVNEGGNVTLTCQASGMPHPAVSWIKPDGQRSVEDVLVLTNINRSEAGEYRCEASNQCGNALETATVDVQCKCVFFSCFFFTVYMGYFYGKLVHDEKEYSDWFPELSEVCNTADC